MHDVYVALGCSVLHSEQLWFVGGGGGGKKCSNLEPKKDVLWKENLPISV